MSGSYSSEGGPPGEKGCSKKERGVRTSWSPHGGQGSCREGRPAEPGGEHPGSRPATLVLCGLLVLESFVISGLLPAG